MDRAAVTGHLVRIAMRGWSTDALADSVENVTVGADFMWVEIDGHRFEAVIDARIGSTDTPDDFLPTITLRLIGPVEIVYTDASGDPLPSDGLLHHGSEGDEFGYRRYLPKPPGVARN